MSLTTAQQSRTRKELLENHRLSGLTVQDLQTNLGFGAQRLDDTLHLRPASDPADVWILRDYLEQEILARGCTPVPFTVLTVAARAAAAQWYRLRPAPGSSRSN